MSEQTAMAPAFMNGFDGFDEVISMRISELNESALGSMPTWRNTFAAPKCSTANASASVLDIDCIVKKRSVSPVSTVSPPAGAQLSAKSSGGVSASSGI